MSNNTKPILAMATILLCTAILGACGGGSGGSGGGGGGGSAAPATPQHSYTVQYASVAFLPDTPDGFVTVTVLEGYRNLFRNDGQSIGTFAEITVISPGGSARLATPSQIGLRTFTLNSSWQTVIGATVGAPVAETVYIADFPNSRCERIPFRSISGDNTLARRYVVSCVNSSQQTVTTTVFKTQMQTYQVCWRDNRRVVTCDLRFNDNSTALVALAFPDQTYRRDNGKCQSAPFYAVGNCQSENAVDVGNFAAFVSGLDGGGYRQFGVRHRFEGEGWNAAAMVSHAKGLEFLDTWWGRLRLEHNIGHNIGDSIGHSIFDDAAAFAEYESGITSLRQNGFMFADIPISGGRVGLRLSDWTASFGRPMHHKGKGKNAAAIHWKFDKESELSFRTHNDNAEMHWQWRRRF